MLDQLLDLLQEGGTHRVTDLAQRLDTSPQLVEAMLDTLTAMGYLKPVAAACGGSCGACPAAGFCTAASGGRVWTLTERAGRPNAGR